MKIVTILLFLLSTESYCKSKKRTKSKNTISVVSGIARTKLEVKESSYQREVTKAWEPNFGVQYQRSVTKDVRVGVMGTLHTMGVSIGLDF